MVGRTFDLRLLRNIRHIIIIQFDLVRHLLYILKDNIVDVKQMLDENCLKYDGPMGD